MKKLITLGISFLFVCSMAYGQERLDLGAQIAEARADIGELETIVCTAIEGNPDRAAEIVGEFIRAFPGQAEPIVFAAISCLPAPVAEEQIAEIVRTAILLVPGAAEAIVFGARRATDEEFHPGIDRVAQETIEAIVRDPDMVGAVPGRTRASSTPGVFVDGSVLSPARADAN